MGPAPSLGSTVELDLMVGSWLNWPEVVSVGKLALQLVCPVYSNIGEVQMPIVQSPLSI